MRKITDFIVKRRNIFLILFISLAILCLYVSTRVNINDDIMKYLPKNSETKIGKDIMDKEFDELDSSNLNVMFYKLSKKEKEETYEKLKEVKGVSSVLYENNENYNKDGYTLYTVNVNDYAKSKTSKYVYDYIDKNFKPEAMSGSISDEYKPVLEMWIVALSIGSALLILILLSESYIEPFLYLVSIGVAVFINKGTNIIFPSVSVITNSIVAVLQLALSMDYSIMLSNRFKQEKKKATNKIDAMKEALYHSFSAISSSSITTVVGLLALVFMSFTIGKDLGFVLAKGVVLSLICIFFCLPALLLLFDGLIEKTHKKSLKLNLTKLGKFSFVTRYAQLFLVLLLFVVAYVIKGNVNILYTGSEDDEVGKVFGSNNQIAIVYENKYENKINELCHKLSEDKKIDQVLCYSNTISDPIAYDELNNKLSELGQDIKLSDELIKIIYFNYYNKDDIKMTADEFVSFLQNDVFENKRFSKSISKDVKNNLLLLSNFTNKEKINQLRSLDELATILGVEKSDLEKILVLYNSKNIDSKMSINSFIEFLNNDVSKNKEYSKYLSTDVKDKLNTLKTFTDKDLINKKMGYVEISKLFNLNKDIVNKLFMFYNINNESSTKLSLNEFSTFILELSKNNDYKDLIDQDTIKMLNLVVLLTDNEKINTKLDVHSMKTTISNLGINLDDELVNNLYVIYNGKNSNLKLNYESFVNTSLNLAQNEKYSMYFSEGSIEQLQSIIYFIGVSDNELSNNEIYELFDIPNSKREVFNYLITGDASGTFNMTPTNFLSLILSNDEVKNSLSSEELNSLSKVYFIIDNKNNKYSYKEMSDTLGISTDITSLIYGVVLKNSNNISNLSLNDLISFIYNNKDNDLLKERLSSYIDVIAKAYSIMNASSNKYSYLEVSKVLGIDSSKTKMIYGLYDYLNNETKISSYEFISLIKDNQNNELLKGYISKDKLSLINTLYEVMNGVINNKKYKADEISKLFSISTDKVKIIYSLYESKNKGYNKISLNNLVNFISKYVITNNDYKSSFSNESVNKIETISLIMNNSLNDATYSAKELSEILSKLGSKTNNNLVELVYIYYGSKNNFDKNYKITIEDLTDYLSHKVINDKRFSSFIDDNKKNKITMADNMINKSKKLLVSDNYSRIILNTHYEFENKDTYKFVNELKNNFKGDKGVYVVGSSPMAVEMNKTFNNELNKITLLTMLFIFLVVAITFRDLIIPFILVLIIQTAVYITMSAISITGGNVYFISLIIVQAILMGATIDYAIVYTSYYRESRLKNDVKTSIVKAYNKSIHTILSSSSILIIVTLVVSNFASAISAKICETISQGAFAATLLILLVLPGTLAATDKLICRGNKFKK